MANLSPLVLDISSDEEAGFGDGRRGGGYGIGSGEFSEDDCYWLTKLLDEVGGGKEDDSDDVVVVSEVFPKSPWKSRLESLKPSAVVGNRSNVDVDGDDCVILDGDPDQPVEVVNGAADDDGGEDKGYDSDDLEIVGEKGEVACRDFPHARHLCAKYAFASTPHQVHCSQCHCYVCDSLAPCSDWGTGISTVDHCHANDKEEYWRVERKRMKKGNKPMPVIPTTSDNSLLEAILQTTQVPASASHNSLSQIEAICPVTIRPCSLSSNVSIAATVSQGHLYGHAPTYVPQSEFVSPLSHPAHCNPVASRDRGNNAGSRSAQSLPPPAVVKLPGFVGSSPNNRRPCGSPLHRGSIPRRYHPFPTTIRNGRHCSYPQNVGRHAAPVLPQPRLSSLPGMATGHANYLPSEPQARSQPFSNSLSRDPVPGQSQMLSHPYVNSNFSSALHMQPRLPSQSSVQNFENLIVPQSHVAFQPDSHLQSQNNLASHLLDAGSAFGDQLHSRCMISSYPRVGNNFESQSSHSQAHDSSTTLLIDDQTNFQQGNYTHNGLDAKPTGFGINQNSSFSHDNQQIDVEASQCQTAVPGDGSLLRYLTEDDDHRSRAAAENFHPPGVALADISSHINGTDCQFPESTSDLNFNLDNWMFENDSFPGALDIPISPDWNEFSSCPTYIDRDTGTQ